MKIALEVSRFGGGWWTKFPSLLKSRESNPFSRGSLTGYDPRPINVTGGIA